MSDFSQLLVELDAEAEALQKGMSAADDDSKIAAAADGDADGDGTPDGEDKVPGGPDKTDPDGGEDDEVLGKSFGVTLADGTSVEAYDGTELIKSIMSQNMALGQTLKKSMAVIGGLKGQVEANAKLVKSLQGQVAKLADSGRGRKAVISITDKQIPGEGEPAADDMSADAFMAKAMDMFNAGKLSGNDIARAEAYIGKGLQPPADVVSVVKSAS